MLKKLIDWKVVYFQIFQIVKFITYRFLKVYPSKRKPKATFVSFVFSIEFHAHNLRFIFLKKKRKKKKKQFLPKFTVEYPFKSFWRNALAQRRAWSILSPPRPGITAVKHALFERYIKFHPSRSFSIWPLSPHVDRRRSTMAVTVPTCFSRKHEPGMRNPARIIRARIPRGGGQAFVTFEHREVFLPSTRVN